MSTAEVALMTGASCRQLQLWAERRMISPLRVGHKRCYTEEDVWRVRLVEELREKGLSLQKIRRVLPKLIRRKEGLAILCRGRVHFFAAPAEMLKFMARAAGPVVLLRAEPV